MTERWTSFLLGGRFSVRPFLEAIPGRRERERGKGLGDTIHTKVPLPPSHLHRKGSARIRQHNEYGAARNLTPLTCTGQYYIGTSKARAVSVCLSFLFLSFCTMFQRKNTPMSFWLFGGFSCEANLYFGMSGARRHHLPPPTNHNFFPRRL